jgi:beta-aspartyl-peptidase (threonine type)
MVYAGQSLKAATEEVIHQELKSIGAEGGLIAVDKDGNIALPFNSAGMYRGWAKPGEREIAIY